MTARRCVVVLASTLVACAAPVDDANDAGPPTFPAAALTTTTSDSGALTLELRTSPQPPVRGTDDAEVIVLDASGAPVDGETLDLVPWMPTMGHGASVKPTITDEGGGRFLVRRLELFMPGEWELRLTLAGTRSDHAVLSIAVP